MGARKRRQGGDRGRGRGRPYQRRRTPPPAATGMEHKYFVQIKETRSPIVAVLTDGRRVEGVIEYFDRDMVKITRPNGPHYFVRKEDIRYLYED
jgi:hypothetical protein